MDALRLPGAMWVRALVLLLSLAALRPGEAATRKEVQTALIFARSHPLLSGTASKWLQHLSDPRLQFSGQVTILLSSSFYFKQYKLEGLTSNRLYSMLNMHILQGRWRAKDLFGLRFGTVLSTKSGPKVRRGFHPKATVMRVNGKLMGPRVETEVLAFLSLPDFYLSPNVVVHALAGVLTPPDFQGGPYTETPF